MMRTNHRMLSLICAVVLVGHLLLGGATPALAQFFDESLEQEDLFVEEDAAFLEESGSDEFGQAGGEQDFTESNRFVDESLVPADRRGTTLGGRRMQITLGRDRETLPLNMAWGAGTGLLIGGWFALINEGNNRQTQRSIGLGIVAGILLGITVGTRTVFDPNAPRPSLSDAGPSPEDGPHFSPSVALEPGQARLGFRMTF